MKTKAKYKIQKQRKKQQKNSKLLFVLHKTDLLGCFKDPALRRSTASDLQSATN